MTYFLIDKCSLRALRVGVVTNRASFCVDHKTNTEFKKECAIFNESPGTAHYAVPIKIEKS